MRRIFVVLVAALAGFFVLAPAAAAAEPDQDLVIQTGRVHVEADESFGTVVTFDGDAVIEGRVENIIAFNGDLRVRGFVRDTAIAFNGRAYVADDAVVRGDVYSRFEPQVSDGATVTGAVGRFDPKWFQIPFGIFPRLAFWLAVSVSTLLLGAVLLLFAPRAAEGAVPIARTQLGPAIATGALLFFGLPIVAILLTASVLGLPFGIGLLLGSALIYPIGYVTSAWLVGRRIVRAPQSRTAAFLAGWAVMRVLALIPIVGGLAWFAATVFGLGVLTVEAWRVRSQGPAPVPAAAV